MKVLVVDVAAQEGGALSILKQFIDKFKEDSENQYIVCLSVPRFENLANVEFINFTWVKRSYLHRLYFDSIYIKKLIKKYRPDRILSLQNKGVGVHKIKQEVYFHNALFICEKRFSFKESKLMWMYQKFISPITRRSLKKVDKIYVQADWIKKALTHKWKIASEKIFVDHLKINEIYKIYPKACKMESVKNLFYPANFYVYKNHITLLKACSEIWDVEGNQAFSLSFTGNYEDVSNDCKQILKNKNYPVSFLGTLSAREMADEYRRSILVYPSYIETVGLPLAEARCMGATIIASDCEYAHDVIGEYDEVTYFSPFDVDSLKKAILKNLNM